MRALLLLLAACSDRSPSERESGDPTAGPGCDGFPTDLPADEPAGACPGGGGVADLAVALTAREPNGEPCAICPGPELVVRLDVLNPCAVEVDYPHDCLVTGGRITGPDGATVPFPAPACGVEAGALPPGGRAHEDLFLATSGSGPHTVEVDLATGSVPALTVCVP